MSDVETTAGREGLRASIIDAAAGVLRDRGARAVTTRAVGEAAGVQAPTIYRLFGDKDGLIDAVAESVMAAYVATKTVSEQSDSADPVAGLRAGWRLHVEFGLAHPELYALLNTAGRAPSPAAAAGYEVLRTRVRRLAAAGVLLISEQRAVDMIHAAGTGVVMTMLALPPERRDNALPEAMLEAVLHALVAPPDGAQTSGPAAVAVRLLTVLPDLPALTTAERALLFEWLTRSIAASEAG